MTTSQEGTPGAAAAGTGGGSTRPILAGLRVLDIAHQYSGAHSACLLGDMGADVLCIEDPEGSPIRTMLPKKGPESLWWKMVQRNKQHLSLKLSTPEGREIFLKLARETDVIIENFRPGTLERWKIGPADLEAAGVNAVLLRISGFGQTGPMSNRPGFGTIAEGMSGFAHLNGFPDGPPTFPSSTLADGVSSVFGVVGVLAAVVDRLKHPGKGVQVVDVALFESLFRIIPTQVAGFDQLKKAPKRPGNYLGDHGVLRNVYRSADNRWLILSSVGAQAIRRILVGAAAADLVERIDAGAMDRPMDEVQEFLWDCNEHLTAWAAAQPYDELVRAMQEAGAVYGPVYDASDIVRDPQYLARGDVISVPDEDLGPILMQGVVPKFPGRQHEVRHAGRRTGADNKAVLCDRLGMTEAEVAELKRKGVV